jgi:hypothetical protein
VRPARSPSPFLRPGGGHQASGWAGAVKAGARALCAPPAGLGLDRRSPPSRYTFPPLGRAGVLAPGRPLGGRRERWPRPQPAQAAWGLRLEREDGDGAGWAGGRKRSQGAARSPWKATQEPATRARRLTARVALPSRAPWRGLGVTGTSGTGGAQRSRCLPLGPLGGGWVRQGAVSIRARCRAHGGQEAVAWQPSQQRGQSGGDASPAAALTGPLQAALTGRTDATQRARATTRRPRALRRGAGTPARGGWHAGPTGYQTRRDTQPTAAVTARRHRHPPARQRTARRRKEKRPHGESC